MAEMEATMTWQAPLRRGYVVAFLQTGSVSSRTIE
jgi:hypothetical protein